MKLEITGLTSNLQGNEDIPELVMAAYELQHQAGNLSTDWPVVFPSLAMQIRFKKMSDGNGYHFTVNGRDSHRSASGVITNKDCNVY